MNLGNLLWQTTIVALLTASIVQLAKSPIVFVKVTRTISDLELMELISNMHTAFSLLIPLIHFATASYRPNNNPTCLSNPEATLFATQILNIPTLPQEDRLPALQILAQENFTFTSDGASLFLQLPLSLPITTSIPSYLAYIAPIPPSTKPWRLLWIGNTCDGTITIYREYYFGIEEFPVRSIEFMELDLEDGKLSEWVAAVNGAAALYAHERVEFTEKAFPQRPRQGVGVGMDGVEVEESVGCGKEEGKRCIGGWEARRVVRDYGRLLVSKPVDKGLAETLLNEDAEMISDSMGFVTMGLVNRTNIKSRAEFVDRAIGVVQNFTDGEPMNILKLAWNCDSIVQYVEFTVPGDVSAGRPTLPVRGFRIFLMDLQSRKIRKVFWEFNSGAWQYALDQIDFKEPFNVTVADDGARYEEYSCGKLGW